LNKGISIAAFFFFLRINVSAQGSQFLAAAMLQLVSWLLLKTQESIAADCSLP